MTFSWHVWGQEKCYPHMLSTFLYLDERFHTSRSVTGCWAHIANTTSSHIQGAIPLEKTIDEIQNKTKVRSVTQWEHSLRLSLHWQHVHRFTIKWMNTQYPWSFRSTASFPQCCNNWGQLWEWEIMARPTSYSLNGTCLKVVSSAGTSINFRFTAQNCSNLSARVIQEKQKVGHQPR